jgi:hypothetical protein
MSEDRAKARVTMLVFVFVFVLVLVLVLNMENEVIVLDEDENTENGAPAGVQRLQEQLAVRAHSVCAGRVLRCEYVRV